MARFKATVSLMHQQQQQQQQQQATAGRLLRHVPARPPPSPQAVHDWLKAESLSHAEAAAASAATAAQAAAGSGFLMDANTGRLVPLQPSATQVPAPYACTQQSASTVHKLHPLYILL